jgi:hypothetical protein
MCYVVMKVKVYDEIGKMVLCFTGRISTPVERRVSRPVVWRVVDISEERARLCDWCVYEMVPIASAAGESGHTAVGLAT